MQYLLLVAATLMSFVLVATAKVNDYRDLAHGINHEARALVNDVVPLGHARAEARKLIARQDSPTVTVTVTSIPEYCTISASNVATHGTSGLSAGVSVPSQTSAIASAPSGEVSGNITSALTGAVITPGTAGQSTATPLTSAMGSYISSSLVANLSSTTATSSSVPASTASEISSSTTSALPTSNGATSYGPGLFSLGALLISWMLV